MSLATRLSALPVDPNRQYCTVGRLLARLAPEDEWADDPTLKERQADYRAFTGALSTPAWSATALARAATQEGHKVDRHHVSEHRRGHTDAVCMRPTVGVIHTEGAS